MRTHACIHVPADCVRALASTSHEAPADLDQPLERLRCLQLLDDVWHTTWALQPAHAATFPPTLTVTVNAGAAAAYAASTPQQQLLQQLQVLLQCAGSQDGPRGVQLGTHTGLKFVGDAAGYGDEGGCAGGGVLDALRCTALRVAGRQGMLARALGAAVSTCQSQQQGTRGAMYAQQLRELLVSSSSSRSGPHEFVAPSAAPAAATRGAAIPGLVEGLGIGGGSNVLDMAQLALVLRPDAGLCESHKCMSNACKHKSHKCMGVHCF